MLWKLIFSFFIEFLTKRKNSSIISLSEASFARQAGKVQCKSAATAIAVMERSHSSVGRPAGRLIGTGKSPTFLGQMREEPMCNAFFAHFSPPFAEAFFFAGMSR